MKTCADCGTIVPDDSVYCYACGSRDLNVSIDDEGKAAKTCADCGTIVPEDSIFCYYCGSINLSIAEDEIKVKETKASKKKIWALTAFIMVALLLVTGAIFITIFLRSDKNKVEVKGVTLSFLEPKDGEVFTYDSQDEQGKSIRFELEANGNFDTILIYVDGKLEGKTKDSYTCGNTKVLVKGKHLIVARAVDEKGDLLATASAEIEIKKSQRKAPIASEEAEEYESSEEAGVGSEEKQYFGHVTLKKYSNSSWSFSINYPEEWTITEEDRSYGHRTKWISPDGNVYFLVDSSLRKPNETDPMENPLWQDKNLSKNAPGYTNYGIKRATFKNFPAAKWEFSYISREEDFFFGKTVRKFDFFILTNKYGYAILFAARPEVYETNIQNFIDIILASFTPLD